MSEPIQHEPGIYFSMPEDEYHADPALGSTSIKAIAIDPYEWQFDRLYGEDRDTDALIFGRAIHARMLEGKEALHDKFCSEMPPDLIPDGALDTVNDLKRFLSEHGQTKFSGMLKPDLIRAVLEINPNAPVVQVIKDRWDAANAGKTPMKPKRWAQIEVAAAWVQRDPLLKDVMKDGTFVEGAPEVSVFYEDRSVRLKARLDRLLRHAIIDLKTFAPWYDGRLEHNALKVIGKLRYDLQEADYRRAWHRGKKLFAEGRVFGEEPFPGFLKECFNRPEPRWFWILVKSKGAPQPLVLEWQAEMARQTASEEVEAAIETYIRLRDEFGDDKDWVPQRQAFIATDSDLPAYFGQ